MKLRVCLALLIALATATAFWRVQGFPFLSYDDGQHVAANPLFHPVTTGHLAYLWRYPFAPKPPADLPPDQGISAPPYKVLWGPLAFTVWGLLACVGHVEIAGQWTLQPGIFHTVNLLLHISNALLVFALLRRFVKSDWAAFAGALLFALHPQQVEPVAWITGMNTLLSTLLALVALLLYFQALDGKGRSKLQLLATGFFALALLAKPYTSITPVIALILLWGRGETQWRPRFKELAAWFVLASLDVLVNLGLRGDSLDEPELKVLFPLRLFLEGDSFFFYLCKLLWPLALSPDYGRKPHWVLDNWWGYCTWLLPVAFTVFLFRMARLTGPRQSSWRLAMAGWAIFFVALVQTSGITPFYFQAVSLVADRYLYFGMLGPALWMALLFANADSSATDDRSPSPLPLAVCAVLALFWGILSWNQTMVWRSDAALWTQALRVNPRSAPAARILGGELVAMGQLDLADGLFHQGLHFTPGDVQLLDQEGDLLLTRGRPDQAATYFHKAVASDPDYAYPHLRLGLIAEDHGDLAGAGAEFLNGLKIAPDDSGLLGETGILAGKEGQPDQAAAFLEQALKSGFDPGRGQLYWGIALAQQGKMDAAIAHWRTGLTADPNMPELHLNLGLGLKAEGKTAEAREEFEQALRLRPGYAAARKQLK